MKTKLTVSCLLALWGTAGAAIRPDGTDDNSYIAYANLPIFDSVGFFSGSPFAGASTAIGSATVIDDGWWGLTAAHNIIGSSGQRYGAFQFGLGSSITAPPMNLSTVDQFWVHPGFTPGQTGKTMDVALLHFSSQITSVAPAIRARDVENRGMQIDIAGFGVPGTASTGPQAFDGNKRGGENIVESFGGDGRYYNIQPQYMMAAFDNPLYGGLLNRY